MFFSLWYSYYFYYIVYVYGWYFKTIFTQRDIQRAIDWFNGKVYWPGPEMSSGGNLPGPFFYLLLLPPLIFGKTFLQDSFIWLFIWLSLSWTVAFYFSRKICQHKQSLFIAIMLLISCTDGSLFLPLFFSWNASFAIMFHILAIMALYYWKTNKQT